MSFPAAACASGRGRSSWSRTQGEAHAGGMGEPEDADPAKVSGVIGVRVVVGTLISAYGACGDQMLDPGPFQIRNQNQNPVAAMISAMTKIRSSAPRSCLYPAARRTSFQAGSTRRAIMSVTKSVSSIPRNADEIPTSTEPVQ